MSFTFMCMNAEFPIKDLGRLDLKEVQNKYLKTLLDRVDLKVKGHLQFL